MIRTLLWQVQPNWGHHSAGRKIGVSTRPVCYFDDAFVIRRLFFAFLLSLLLLLLSFPSPSFFLLLCKKQDTRLTANSPKCASHSHADYRSSKKKIRGVLILGRIWFHRFHTCWLALIPVLPISPPRCNGKEECLSSWAVGLRFSFRNDGSFEGER